MVHISLICSHSLITPIETSLPWCVKLNELVGRRQIAGFKNVFL